MMNGKPFREKVKIERSKRRKISGLRYSLVASVDSVDKNDAFSAK